MYVKSTKTKYLRMTLNACLHDRVRDKEFTPAILGSGPFFNVRLRYYACNQRNLYVWFGTIDVYEYVHNSKARLYSVGTELPS